MANVFIRLTRKIKIMKRLILGYIATSIGGFILFLIACAIAGFVIGFSAAVSGNEMTNQQQLEANPIFMLFCFIAYIASTFTAYWLSAKHILKYD